MSDMLVHTFFVIGIYTTLKFIIREKFLSFKYIFFYSIVLGCMCYTSWLGYVFAAVVCVYGLWKLQYVRGFYMLLFLSVIVPAIVGFTMLKQYSEIAGVDALLSEMFHRYRVRGSVPVGEHNVLMIAWRYVIMVKDILLNYIMHYNAVFLWLAVVFGIIATNSKMKFLFSRNGYRFVILSGFTIVILHLLFLEYSHHDFTVLYGSVFLSVVVGVIYDKISFSNVLQRKTINLSIAAMLLLMLGEYYVMNLPGAHSIKGESYAEAKQFGEQINAQVPVGKVVFLIGHNPDALEIYYSNRNIKTVESVNDAMSFLYAHKVKEGVVLFADENGKLSHDPPYLIHAE